MKLLLVCSGDAEDLSMRPDLGHNDPPLTSTGLKQAEAIAKALKDGRSGGLSFAGLYTSPILSASQTASILSEELSLPISGALSGLTTLTPEYLPDASSGSALEALQSNAWDSVQFLKESYIEEPAVIAVSHRLPILAIVCRALGMSLKDVDRMRVSPGSLTTLDFRAPPRERVLLDKLNDLCHND